MPMVFSRAAAAQTSGTLALFDFAVAPSVPPGTKLALDLSGVTLNGQPVADNVAGADGTDGRVSIVLAPPEDAAGTAASPNATLAARAALLGGQAA